MRTLQDVVDRHPDLVDHFFNDTISQFHRSRTDLFARANLIPPQYTNWRDEHRAIRETCLLTNQSHHMPVLYVGGPDARRLLQHLSPISLANMSTDMAKQYFACTTRGHHIGDCVLYYHGEDHRFELISGMPLLNWVQFHAASNDWDVTTSFDPTTPFSPSGTRTKFRFQIEGPTALAVLEEVTEEPWPELKFFRTAPVNIAGCDVLVLRHGMNSVGGAELSGDYRYLDAVRDAIVAAGQRHGLLLGGTLTYFSCGVVSGWVPYPLPGIYTGEDLRTYREWLPHDSWEANMQLAGSFRSSEIDDYYWTPSGLGYDRLVCFDHDFIGRAALEGAQDQPKRVHRMLEWNAEDVAKVFASQFRQGPLFKAIELPTPIYGWPQADEVRAADGTLIGMSQYAAYTANERVILSMSCIDEKRADPGDEVMITWGEAGGGSNKPHVEAHEQATIRATLHTAPYGSAARAGKKTTLAAS